MATINYDRIPEEMRWDRQWALAGPDDTGKFKAPHAVGPKGPFKISPTQSAHLLDLEAAIEAAQQFQPCGIGFMLSKEDCYTCIDLDVKNEHNEPNPEKRTTPEQLQRFYKIIEAFDSYTERSASGQGFHIWVKGKIGSGCKRDGVEVYSQERFIVCTGDVVIDKDIEERQDLLAILVGEINNGKSDKVELRDIEETESDEVILERARTAINADKFSVLYAGDWSGYPSQSEADLALMSIFTFYSKSNTQCRRLFRGSGLGQRTKATKNDRYLNDTLRVIRGREAREEQLDAVGAAAAKALLDKVSREAMLETLPPHLIMDDKDLPSPQFNVEPDDGQGLPWPPGCLGEIAQYIYKRAPRPVKEIAIVSAMGFMAGICGKTYIYEDSGINLYVVLVGRSGVGKETMHTGISNLVNQIASASPAISQYVDFTDYASGPALLKAVLGKRSFVNVNGEWGQKLKRIAEDGYSKDSSMQSFKQALLNLYQKSGPTSIVGGIGYSDKEKNVAAVTGVAYSMIGETTPGTFYECLTETMMQDGFMSRFTIIEYEGDRPANNRERKNVALDTNLYDYLCSLVTHVTNVNERAEFQEVMEDPEAHKLLSDFDLECDDQIRAAGSEERYRQMWNRAHLKACRISALLAAADNYVNPVIRKVHAEWAIALIRRDITTFTRRFNTGEVGSGNDSQRETKILSILRRYAKVGVSEGYKIPEAMVAERIVPRRYLQICTQRAPGFVNYKGGQNQALDNTIKILIDNGYLQEFPKDKAATKFNFVGKCYRIINL